MKKTVFFLFVFFSCLFATAQKIELKGTYQGKNLYIQNPVIDTGKIFCTNKVLVNGNEIYFKNESAYEIKLDSLGFKILDPVKIEIFHKPDCKPKVISDNLSRRSTYELVSISVDSNAVLHFTTKGEIGKLPFVIEQFRWNKWVKIGEVDGKGGIQENEYSFQTLPHSGKNQFRVKQVDNGSCIKLSKTAEFISAELHVKLTTNQFKLADELEFNKETMYELYDKNGNIVRRGFGKKINLKGLERGGYYLNYDNKITEDVVKFW